jgi:YVTN family beta-propeller protein
LSAASTKSPPIGQASHRRPIVVALVAVLLVCASSLLTAESAPAAAPAAEPRQPLLFLPSFGSNVVSVLDPQTDRVIDYIGMQAKGASVAYASPDQQTVYVVAGADHYVSEIDTASLSVRRVIPFEGVIGDRGSALPDDGSLFWLATLPEGNIEAIDTSQHKVTRIFERGGNMFANSRDGHWLYVVTSNRTFEVHDATDFRVVSSIPLPHGIGFAAMVSPDGRRVYLIGGGDIPVPLATVTRGFVDVVDVADPGAPRLIKSVTTGPYTFNAEFTPDGRQLWVLNGGDGTIDVIDVATNEVVHQIATGRQITAITFYQNKAYLLQDPRPIPPTYATALAITIAGPFGGALLTPGSGETTTRAILDTPAEIAIYDRFTYQRTGAPTVPLPSMVFTPALASR